jgi:hypothetical protein
MTEVSGLLAQCAELEARLDRARLDELGGAGSGGLYEARALQKELEVPLLLYLYEALSY